MDIFNLQSEFDYRHAKFEREIFENREEIQKMIKELNNNRSRRMNNFEKIKNMTLDKMANLLVICINSYEEVADFEYLSTVLPSIYYDKELCIKETKQWLQQESEDNNG